jgi:hypothetical protein
MEISVHALEKRVIFEEQVFVQLMHRKLRYGWNQEGKEVVIYPSHAPVGEGNV